MGFNLNTAFGIHEHALKLRAERAQVISNNIANADTPGYKARDFDFSAVLRDQEAGVALRTTDSKHIGSGVLRQADLKFRQPLQASLDGNTVEAHNEKAEFMRNSMMYSATLTFLNARISGLLNAIRGGQ